MNTEQTKGLTKVFLCAFGLLTFLVSPPIYAQNIHEYFKQMLSNPEIASRLGAYKSNYLKDRSVKESAQRDYARICEAAKISMYRGGKGWEKSILEMTILYNEMKNWDYAAMGLFTYENMDKSCYTYK